MREAEAVGGKNANENFLIERMRMAAASGAGDADTAARSFEALSGSSRKIRRRDKLRMIESIAGSVLPRRRTTPRPCSGAQRYFSEGGTSGRSARC